MGLTKLTKSEEPHDRLTLIGDAVIGFVHENPDHDDVKLIVLLEDDKEYGIALNGYQEVTDAVVTLVLHLRAMLRSIGKDVVLVPLSRRDQN
jgi:hypothetical protein